MTVDTGQHCRSVVLLKWTLTKLSGQRRFYPVRRDAGTYSFRGTPRPLQHSVLFHAVVTDYFRDYSTLIATLVTVRSGPSKGGQTTA